MNHDSLGRPAESSPILSSRSEPSEGESALHAPPGFLSWVAALVHRHRPRLLGYARRHGLSAEDALDAVQDAFLSFLKLPQSRAIADRDDEALRFLFVILRHTLMNQKRKLRRRREKATEVQSEALPLSSPDSESLIAHAEELGRLRGCILRMAHLQRSVVVLSLLDEHPNQHVADMLNITSGHVRVLLHRARQHLRSCAEDDPPAHADELDAIRLVTNAAIAT